MMKGRLMMDLLDASGAILLVLSAAYLVSGFAIAGAFGFNYLITPSKAFAVHTVLQYAVIPALAVHCGIGGYSALKRRRLIG